MTTLDTGPPTITYHLCRECLYRDASDRCLEQCDVIVVVTTEECQGDMHPQLKDEE